MKDAFNCGGSGRRSRSFLTIPASVHEAVMALSEEDRHDRAKAGEIDCVRRAALSAPSLGRQSPMPRRRRYSQSRSSTMKRNTTLGVHASSTS
jgi:hypothetical protein